VSRHTATLRPLAEELLEAEQLARLNRLVSTNRPEHHEVEALDLSIGGPSLGRLSCGEQGRFHPDDATLFRPLQYCHMCLIKASRGDDFEWFTRIMVHMSSLHIEVLVKAIGETPRLPLGPALRQSLLKRRINDDISWRQLDTLREVNNDAKHALNPESDAHLFSPEDSLLAYVVCRKLALRLYPVAKVVTDPSVFAKPCN
jgi:hypothetical protein